MTFPTEDMTIGVRRVRTGYTITQRMGSQPAQNNWSRWGGGTADKRNDQRTHDMKTTHFDQSGWF